jgi:putative transcriptional regulator
MYPNAGDVIQGSGGLRKVRWSALVDVKVNHPDTTALAQIVAGKRKPSRVFEVNANCVKALRAKVGSSQRQFARLLHVDVGTLRNREQGRREPQAPQRHC